MTVLGLVIGFVIGFTAWCIGSYAWGYIHERIHPHTSRKTINDG
jgi:hypothetical protein